MNSQLKGRRILFFSPAFFGYEAKIKKKMEDMGAQVDFFDERSVTRSYEKALLKISPYIFQRKTEKYYTGILKRIRNKKYDSILFIKCEMPGRRVLTALKAVFPEAEFCLYMWDSIANIRGIKEKFQYFDHIKTFDKKDSRKEHIGFRPLFFCDEFQKKPMKDSECKYDLCFIGTLHSDRYHILKKIQCLAEIRKLRVFIYPYLQSRFIFYFYKLVKSEYKGTCEADFAYQKLGSREIADIVLRSRAVIDIQHPKQRGLTMRTIEMLGMNKKLITTNDAVRQYDFYNACNIQVIDRDRIYLDSRLFGTDYIEPDREIYQSYTLESWILSVLGEDDEK